MDEWKAIESAPKDGSEFQVWVESYGWEPKCRFRDGNFEILDDEFGWDKWFDQGLITHWMPYPSPPTPRSRYDQTEAGNSERQFGPESCLD